jgi:glycosyltransferase involved in cell wall biosynthesis
VIPNFVNCDLYVRKPDPKLRAEWAPDGEPILMHLSNFRPVKRILDAVEIFTLVREKMPAKLVMIGDGPDREPAEALARTRGVEKDVLFLGKQNGIKEKLEPGDVKTAAKYAIELLSRPDRGREMGQLARVSAKKKFCANDVIPMYENYYEQVLASAYSAKAAR